MNVILDCITLHRQIVRTSYCPFLTIYFAMIPSLSNLYLKAFVSILTQLSQRYVMILLITIRLIIQHIITTSSQLIFELLSAKQLKDDVQSVMLKQPGRLFLQLLKQQKRHANHDAETVEIRVLNLTAAKEPELITKEAVTLDVMLISKDNINVIAFC